MIINFKNYFLLSTRQIVTLSFFISIDIVLALVSHYIPFIWPDSYFLKFELTDFIFLILANFYNLFYVFLAIILCAFLRIPDATFPIGNVAIILADITLVSIFSIFNFFFSKININKNLKKILLAIITILLTSILLSLYNKIFLIQIYAIFFPSYGPFVKTLTSNLFIWTIVFPFNLVNIAINVTIFISFEYVITFLKEKYKTQ